MQHAIILMTVTEIYNFTCMYYNSVAVMVDCIVSVH